MGHNYYILMLSLITLLIVPTTMAWDGSYRPKSGLVDVSYEGMDGDIIKDKTSFSIRRGEVRGSTEIRYDDRNSISVKYQDTLNSTILEGATIRYTVLTGVRRR